jgi:hypothetical protein
MWRSVVWYISIPSFRSNVRPPSTIYKSKEQECWSFRLLFYPEEEDSTFLRTVTLCDNQKRARSTVTAPRQSSTTMNFFCVCELLTRQFMLFVWTWTCYRKFIFITVLFSVSFCCLFLRKIGPASLSTHGTESFLLLSSCLFLHETHVHICLWISSHQIYCWESVVHTSNDYCLCQVTQILERCQSYRLPLSAAPRCSEPSILTWNKKISLRQTKWVKLIISLPVSPASKRDQSVSQTLTFVSCTNKLHWAEYYRAAHSLSGSLQIPSFFYEGRRETATFATACNCLSTC